MPAYEPHNADGGDLGSGMARSGIRWRVTTATLVGAVGLLTIAGNVALFIHRIFVSDEIPWENMPWRFRICEVELRLVAVLVGVAWIVAAVIFFHGSWKPGLLLAIPAFIVGFFNPAINRTFRHHFAGDTYRIEGAMGEVTVVSMALPNTAPTRGDPEFLNSPFDELTAKRKQEEWAKHLKLKSIERNSIGMEIVLIPPGAFLLGSTESLPELEKAFPIIEINNNDQSFNRGIESEWPPRKVRITSAFYLGKFNVTLAQFRQFVNSTAYKTEAEKDGKGGWGYIKGENPPLSQKVSFNWRTTGFAQQDDCPVVNVSWNDAMSFCDWLSKKERKTYRLPTDAEWEYACRAGTITRYATGNHPDDLLKAANVADVAYFTMLLGGPLPPETRDRSRAMGMMVNGDDRYAFTSPVGKFKPNAFGLFDMLGNASTWCIEGQIVKSDAHAEVDNPRGPSRGPVRVVRGGNWAYYPAFCRSASRFAYGPSRSELFLGLRVVCPLREK